MFLPPSSLFLSQPGVSLRIAEDKCQLGGELKDLLFSLAAEEADSQNKC